MLVRSGSLGVNSLGGGVLALLRVLELELITLVVDLDLAHRRHLGEKGKWWVGMRGSVASFRNFPNATRLIMLCYRYGC